MAMANVHVIVGLFIERRDVGLENKFNPLLLNYEIMALFQHFS